MTRPCDTDVAPRSTLYAPPFVVKDDPPVGEACAHCHGPLRQPVRNHAEADTGTRLHRAVWEHHLASEPFCSTECCRAFHGCELDLTRLAA